MFLINSSFINTATGFIICKNSKKSFLAPSKVVLKFPERIDINSFTLLIISLKESVIPVSSNVFLISSQLLMITKAAEAIAITNKPIGPVAAVNAFPSPAKPAINIGSTFIAAPIPSNKGPIAAATALIPTIIFNVVSSNFENAIITLVNLLINFSNAPANPDSAILNCNSSNAELSVFKAPARPAVCAFANLSAVPPASSKASLYSLNALDPRANNVSIIGPPCNPKISNASVPDKPLSSINPIISAKGFNFPEASKVSIPNFLASFASVAKTLRNPVPAELA